MRSIDDMVRMEVHYCASGLVHTLANGYGRGFVGAGDLAELTEQATELFRPLEEWEDAAREAGWKSADTTPGMMVNDNEIDENGQAASFEGSWQELCEEHGIEPYEREVYEHWIVSDWFARQLESRGEKVDHDFAGLTVWARTTTGQGIAMDSVVESIYRATHKAEV